MTSPLPKIKSLAPWFGGARTNAKLIGREIGKRVIVSIPFCGGCSEVLYIDSRQIILNDLHEHIINLAEVVADAALLAEFIARLETVLIHPRCLAAARTYIGMVEEGEAEVNRAEWAAAYFTLVWISRQNAGSDSELTSGLASRRTASGGSSVKRWRS